MNVENPVNIREIRGTSLPCRVKGRPGQNPCVCEQQGNDFIDSVPKAMISSTVCLLLCSCLLLDLNNCPGFLNQAMCPTRHPVGIRSAPGLPGVFCRETALLFRGMLVCLPQA